MKLNLPKIQDADLKDKIVLVRVDHNVVKKGIIHDSYRIDSTLGTLYNINAKGGKIILMSHVGRPKNKKTGEITIDDNTSVQPIVDYLNEKLNINIKVAEFTPHGEQGLLGVQTSVNHIIRQLRNGEIDGIYLPNTRWFAGEEAKDESSDRLGLELAGLADIYVNDAFGSWQAHASTVKVADYLPSYAGHLMQKEIYNLDKIYSAKNPFVAVVAGSKMDTKIDSLYALLKTADKLVLGGVLYNAYLCAKYGIKIKGIDDTNLTLAKEFVKYAEKYPDKIVELEYIVESDTLDGKLDGQHRTHYIHDLKQGQNLNYVLDVASRSFQEKNVRDAFLSAKTVFVNAVMGLAPYFNEGTIALDQLIDENAEAVKLYGGGDTMQELKRLLPGLYMKALNDPKYYMFTGGGAVLKALQEGTYSGLEPVKALMNCKRSS